MLPERRADFHQLEARFELLDQHVDLDGAVSQPQVPLERREDVVPERRFLGRLNLRQIERQRRVRPGKLLVVVDDVERGVDDGRREAGTGGVTDVAVVEVQAAGPEQLGREVELRAPVLNGVAAEELARPAVHLAGHLLGGATGTRGRGGSRASGSAGCPATSSTPGPARPRRRTSSRRRPTAARARRCGCLPRRWRGVWRPGPVPWIHWRRRSAGISLPANAPSLASCTLMRVRGMYESGSRNVIRCLSRARCARRAILAAITALRSASSPASASSAATASGVRTSLYSLSRLPRTWSRPALIDVRDL